MIKDVEIRGFAGVLVKSYGRAARERCARNTRKLLADGDVEGYAMWCRIEQTVDGLLRDKILDAKSDGEEWQSRPRGPGERF
ncbi:MAG: hypothetical protein MI920_31400 [Kiloniellales bacterium]|nr:hypothetical protein [Kiloniellales bacterium]